MHTGGFVLWKVAKWAIAFPKWRLTLHWAHRFCLVNRQLRHNSAVPCKPGSPKPMAHPSYMVTWHKMHVGPFGCGLAAQSILNGTYVCPPESNEYTCMFIEALWVPHSRPDLISTILSPEVFVPIGVRQRNTPHPHIWASTFDITRLWLTLLALPTSMHSLHS